MVVINKAGGAGGEGFLDLKASSGNPHKVIITLSNLFTTPLATGIPFNWKDLTPVAMLALDEFVLWVNAEKPYNTAKDYVDAVKKAPAGSIKMGGTGSKQEDQIITVAVRSSPTFPTRAAAKSPCNSLATTSTRPSTIRSRRWRNGAAANSVRSACSTPSL
jgi:tripartite-type tricarboxylate transporter receptor subunit TctC